jgi:hypothetical protein
VGYGRIAAMTIPPEAPGHGNGNTGIRAQPVLKDAPGGGRKWSETTGIYEIICYACGDDYDLNYSEVSSEIQRIRGPYPSVESAQAALMKHTGLGS